MSDKTKNGLIWLTTLILSSLLVWVLMTQKIVLSSSTKQDITITQDFLTSEYNDILEGASDAIAILVDKIENMVKSFDDTSSNNKQEEKNTLEVRVN